MTTIAGAEQVLNALNDINSTNKKIMLTAEKNETKLINNILLAASQEEVKNFIDTALKTFQQNNVKSPAISRFIEKMICELELFNPMDKGAQQWSNIKLAGIMFNRIKNNLSTTA